MKLANLIIVQSKKIVKRVTNIQNSYTTCIMSTHLCYKMFKQNKDIKLLEKSTKQMSSNKVKNLMPNLNYKERYVLHYRNLQIRLRLKMKLEKVHRLLKFKQSEMPNGENYKLTSMVIKDKI